MLANDSSAAKKQSEFFLVVRPHQAVAELMAECPSCGAITSILKLLHRRERLLEVGIGVILTRRDELAQRRSSRLGGSRERVIEAAERFGQRLAQFAPALFCT